MEIGRCDIDTEFIEEVTCCGIIWPLTHLLCPSDYARPNTMTHDLRKAYTDCSAFELQTLSCIQYIVTAENSLLQENLN